MGGFGSSSANTVRIRHSVSSGMDAIPKGAMAGHIVDTRPSARGRFLPKPLLKGDTIACALSNNVEPDEVTHEMLDEYRRRARTRIVQTITPAHLREAASRGMTRTSTRSLFLRDTHARMGYIDERNAPASDARPGTAGSATNADEELVAALEKARRLGSSRAGESGSGDDDIFGEVTLTSQRISTTEYLATEWTMDTKRQRLADLPNLNNEEWWCKMSGAGKAWVNQLHHHKYNCRERFCEFHRGAVTCGLVALGQWNCTTRFSVSVLNVATMLRSNFYFYVESDCCPPKMQGGWAKNGITVLSDEVFKAMPPFTRPQDRAMTCANIHTSATRHDGSEGTVEVKVQYLVYRYNRAIVDDLTSFSAMCSTIDELTAYAFERYKCRTMPGRQEFLLTHLGSAE